MRRMSLLAAGRTLNAKFVKKCCSSRIIEVSREPVETEAIESIPEQSDLSDDPLAAHVNA